MTIGRLSYACVECRKSVALDVFPTITEITEIYFRWLFDLKLCSTCLEAKIEDNKKH